jgi:hypothetical protein
MPTSSISGYVYYVSFIDDYSCKTWIYFLKSKDEVFSKFKEFKALKIQYISTDEHVADVMIKPLSRVKFEHFRDNLGMVRKDLP